MKRGAGSTVVQAQRALGALVAMGFAISASGDNFMKQVTGTFDVSMAAGAPVTADNVSRRTLQKQYHGGLEGSGNGEMLSAGDPAQGNAGYVAIERVIGVLDGRKGSFALMQMATMKTGSAPILQAVVAPGSGTGDLAGITGQLKIIIEGKQHRYEFDYQIP